MNIKTLREKRGLTQKQLAEALGVKPTTVSAWETRNISIPAPQMKKLSEIFGVPVSDIENPGERTGEKLDFLRHHFTQLCDGLPDKGDGLISSLITLLENAQLLSDQTSETYLIHGYTPKTAVLMVTRLLENISHLIKYTEYALNNHADYYINSIESDISNIRDKTNLLIDYITRVMTTDEAS